MARTRRWREGGDDIPVLGCILAGMAEENPCHNAIPSPIWVWPFLPKTRFQKSNRINGLDLTVLFAPFHYLAKVLTMRSPSQDASLYSMLRA
jgi:hypothetical protein